MEVRNVSSAQNFGMALRIKPGAKEALRGWSEHELQRLAKLGEELKDHKHVDVVIDDAGKMILDLKCANKYKYVALEADPTMKDFVRVSGEHPDRPGTRIRESFQFKTSEIVQDLIEKTASKKYYDEIERIGTIAKAFEERGAWKAELEAAEKARVERVNSAVDDLIGKFGAEA